MTATAVYRLFAVDGELLYVGMTNHVYRRFAQHSVHKGWWLEVDHHEAEWFQSREVAEVEESDAIWQERPAYNIRNPIVEQNVPSRRSPRRMDMRSVAQSLVDLGFVSVEETS